MPKWLREREALLAFYGSFLGTALLVLGEFYDRDKLSDNGTMILSVSVAALGLSRVVAKSGASK